MAHIRDLEMYVAVATHRSFRGAARNLGETPTRVSRSVARLESALGVALLERTTCPVTLTSSGRLYADTAARVLAELRDAERRLRAPTAMGLVRISVPTGLGRALLAERLAGLGAQHPGLELRLDATDVDVPLGEGAAHVVVRIAS